MAKKGFLDGYKTYNTEEGFGSPESWRQAFQARMGLDEARQILSEKDPYAIMGLSRGASQEEVKRCYRKLALKYHPDHHPDDPEAESKFKKMVAAYTIIMDTFKRR